MLKSFQYKKKEYNSIPLMVTLLGIDHHQEPVYRTKGIGINQFLFCKKGKGELLLENRKYVIEKGQCFFIQKDMPHEYHALDSDWVLDIIGFNGSIVQNLLRTLKLEAVGAYRLDGNINFDSRLKKINKISEQDIPHKYMVMSQELYSFLTDLSFDLTTIHSRSIDYGNPVITQAVDYIESNYNQDISLDALAAAVSRTPEYLCSIFKKYTGLTIVNYINSVRLLHASIMLVQEPSLPVNEVAQSCGFRSPSYFGKMFQKQYNATPNQYRMSHVL